MHAKQKAYWVVDAGNTNIKICRVENDQIIEGNKDNPISVIDQWTFKKALKDKNPAWQLISTQSES